MAAEIQAVAFFPLGSNLNPKQVTPSVFIWTAAGLKKSQIFPRGKECVRNASFPCRREIFSHMKHNVFPLKSAYIPPNLSFPTFKQRISIPVLTRQRAELNNHQVLRYYRQRPETPPRVSACPALTTYPSGGMFFCTSTRPAAAEAASPEAPSTNL